MTTLVVACIVMMGAFIQSTTGFGFAFFSLPLCSLIVDFPVAVVMLVLLAQVLNTIVLFQHRWRADWKGSVLPLTLFSLPGIPVGVWLLQWLDVRVLQGGLGAILVFYSLYQWFARPVPRVIGLGWKAVAGAIGGVLGGALNSAGPPILVYVSLQPWDKERVKCTIIGFFFTTGLAIMATQASQGLVTAEVQRLALWCLPALAMGTVGGRMLFKRLGEGGYRQVFIALLFALGVMMLVKSTLAWIGG